MILAGMGAKPSSALKRMYASNNEEARFLEHYRIVCAAGSESLYASIIAGAIENGKVRKIPKEWITTKDTACKSARRFRSCGYFYLADQLDRLVKQMPWTLDMGRDYMRLYLEAVEDRRCEW